VVGMCGASGGHVWCLWWARVVPLVHAWARVVGTCGAPCGYTCGASGAWVRVVRTCLWWVRVVPLVGTCGASGGYVWWARVVPLVGTCGGYVWCLWWVHVAYPPVQINPPEKWVWLVSEKVWSSNAS
jgi:hypothetical protein